ncbi:MAG TPA: hypothetical protein EYH45_05615 [Candidatus Caldiarchaeum subterraneum]|uniref:UPF0201 protein EYH45_05615 n=1 Tax=Caldiarchaeum subterraneum TaxID=311458 RepID=A0A832ZW85_CALS0|nr:hypothetical protein [Candidatus Caldarchaeum subterraneum]
MVTVQIEVDIYPTEDEERVSEAVKNIFPHIILSYERLGNYGRIKGIGEGRDILETLRMLIRSRRIRSAARAFLKKHRIEKRLEFLLNKHAASVGKVSFCESESETPLGAIKVIIEDDEMDNLIRWLTE